MLDGEIRNVTVEFEAWLPLWLENSLSLNPQLFPKQCLLTAILVLHSVAHLQFWEL